MQWVGQLMHMSTMGVGTAFRHDSDKLLSCAQLAEYVRRDPDIAPSELHAVYFDIGCTQHWAGGTPKAVGFRLVHVLCVYQSVQSKSMSRCSQKPLP